MKTLLFFDDWLIQEQRGLTRKWFQAELFPGFEPYYDPTLQHSFCHPIVRKNPDTGRYTMWASGSVDISKGDEGFSLCIYDSEDGLDFNPVQLSERVDRLASDKAPHAVFSGRWSSAGSSLFYDERETDPAKRYKVAYSEVAGAHLTDDDVNKIAYSPDGIHWTIDDQSLWRKNVTDTFYSIIYNPYTQKYQFTGRPIWGDRRIALYQTQDWHIWEQPIVVVYPDPMDPPCVEFYGMPQFCYEGYFLGYLWRMHAAYDDYGLAVRMKGRVDSELVYSINGITWNRTNRESFLPDMGIGSRGFLGEYPSYLMDDGDWLRVYCTSYIGEHDEVMEAGKQISYLTTYRYRKDGFCALQTHSEKGFIVLRPMVAKGGGITINTQTTICGGVRAELRMVPDNTPIPGFEMENSVPITGDSTSAVLKWKNRELMDVLAGQPFRLVLELDQARVYAVRMDADYVFASLEQTNLFGDYTMEHARMPLPWFTPGRDGDYPK